MGSRAGERRFRSCFLPWFQGLTPQVPDTAVIWSGYLSCCKKALQRGPLNRAGFHIQQPIENTETRRRNMPSARRRHFCLLLLPGKSTSAGGPRPADEMVSPHYKNRRQCAMMELETYHQQIVRGDRDEDYHCRTGFGKKCLSRCLF